MKMDEEKQRRMMELIEEGRSSRKIADELSISKTTVQEYKKVRDQLIAGKPIPTPPRKNPHTSDNQNINDLEYYPQGDQPRNIPDKGVNPVHENTMWYIPWHSWPSAPGMNCTPMYPTKSFENPAPSVSEEQRRMIDERISKRLEEERIRQQQEEQATEIKTLKEKIETETKRQQDAQIKKLEQNFKTYAETFSKPKKLNEGNPVKTPEPQVSKTTISPPPSPPQDIENIIQETVPQEFNARENDRIQPPENKVNPAPKIEQKTNWTPFGDDYKLLRFAEGVINAKPQITELIKKIINYRQTGVFPDSSPIRYEKTTDTPKKPNQMIFPFTPLQPIPLNKKNSLENTKK